MKFSGVRLGAIDCYRVKTDRWHRTWQAEWVNPSTGNYCPRAPRAWTLSGLYRKSLRWYRRQNRAWGLEDMRIAEDSGG
jgi:hypothetical protein